MTYTGLLIAIRAVPPVNDFAAAKAVGHAVNTGGSQAAKAVDVYRLHTTRSAKALQGPNLAAFNPFAISNDVSKISQTMSRFLLTIMQATSGYVWPGTVCPYWMVLICK